MPVEGTFDGKTLQNLRHHPCRENVGLIRLNTARGLAA
jgi:hypothetical protein